MKIKFLLMLTSVVFFLNACSKDDNEVAETLETPVANAPKDVNDNGFKAKWNYVSYSKSYLLDVSTTENFTSFIPNYNAKEVTDLNEVVVGLTGGTQYYYRVRAKNETEISGYSNVISVVTTGSSGIPEDPTFLKVKANKLANPFFVGMAIKASQLTNGSPYDVILRNEFSSISAEYEMKMDQISTASGVYNWTVADKIVAYGNANNINVHGHALVWHNSVPQWLKDFSGTDAEFAAEVKKYITAVVTHYAGKVKSWDVVNEAVDDNGGVMRNTIFLQRMGPNYVKDCFQWAREAATAAGDTSLLLFYNDYATSANTAKQNKVFSIVDDLKASNIIDGVGFQMHNTYLSPTKAQIETDLNKAVAKGLKIHVSELDIQVNQFNDISSFTNERRLAQKEKYKEMVKIYNALPAANKYALTIWGMKDNESWIPFNTDLGHPGNDWPLLYDSNFAIKSSHTGFLEGLD
ncbi:endo-1,4-beta-xylanase [Flavobacterium sp. CF108]|uniref:endo-1,4-beta-xylanase n=1 Tax=unclassified Flavobacterium TaxID=196869 RepID=UPI0008AD7876|nr:MULTISPECIES: endo-1,4-beta-xylanase [unclassified Flavobacterium]SEP03285.1 endo-1,4-beta-xylanase [Flavobacterium sp. fv08]SHH98043.1 endo-1,4-beta-xylanase [Flavobacterium sp. CF108]